MWQLKTTTVPVLVAGQGMIKKRSDNHISKIFGSPNQYEIPKRKKKSTIWNCSFFQESSIDVTEKYHLKRQKKKKNKYKEYV